MHVELRSPLERWLYAIACVAAPVLWGLLMVGVTELLERALARKRQRTHPEHPVSAPEPIDYHI